MRILRQIGRGGDADVYVAQQESLDRTVAVKVLRHDIEDPASWRAFLREALTVAKLSGHPHVVTVYDAGRSTVSGHPYMVTEFLDRGSLHDVIAEEGPLAPVRVAEIGTATADALQAAHALAIHHRDVKPGNVLLGRDGRTKLADFGIARLLSGRSVTTTDLYAFTPEHVAPEVLRHEPDGQWSDLYGLASTLATALVGAAPLRRREGECIDAYLARKMMAPAPRLPASVPRSMADPIERALDPSPDRRPSVAEFKHAMATCAALLRADGGAGGAVVPAPTKTGRRTTLLPLPWLGRNDPAAADPPDRSPLRRWLLIFALCFGVWSLAVVTVVLLTRDGSGSDAQTASTPAPSTAPASTALVATPAATTPTATSLPAVAPSTISATVPATTPATALATPPPTTPVASTAPATPATTVPVGTEPATEPPATTAPAPPPAALGAAVSPEEAEGFIRTYYDEVEAGDYASSWARLTPEFQRGKARSFDYYVNFWNENDIEIGDVRLVSSDADSATVHVDLRWSGSGSWLTDEFTLRRGSNGQLLIAAQTAVDR